MRSDRLLRSLCTLALAAALLAPTGAEAACSGTWDLTGTWVATQSNGAKVTFDLQQDGTVLSGNASVPNPVVSSTSLPIAARSVEGSVEGDAVAITVYWDGPSVGIYSGEVNKDGWLYGEGYDKLNPASRASWTSDRKMKRCKG